MPPTVPNKVPIKEDYYVIYCMMVATVLCSVQHIYFKEGREQHGAT